jgi:hypothetical protein
MRRRALLSLVPALLGGCLSAATPPREAGGSDELPPTGDGALSEFDAGDPFDTLAVGDRDAATGHRIVVWNDDVEPRPIRVLLRSADDGGVAADLTRTFPAYGSLRITVFRPADYVLDVRGPRDERRRFGVRREFVGCTDSATHVAVRPDGSIRGRTVSTPLACDAGSAAALGVDPDTP